MAAAPSPERNASTYSATAASGLYTNVLSRVMTAPAQTSIATANMPQKPGRAKTGRCMDVVDTVDSFDMTNNISRSEEHTSELQSRGHLVCRLLLEKKKKILSVDVQ